MFSQGNFWPVKSRILDVFGWKGLMYYGTYANSPFGENLTADHPYNIQKTALEKKQGARVGHIPSLFLHTLFYTHAWLSRQANPYIFRLRSFPLPYLSVTLISIAMSVANQKKSYVPPYAF